MAAALIAAAPAVTAPARAVADATDPPLVATFSIVGFDPATGDLGVAVASRFLAVGHVVPWARAGVGAIATQALANTTYGPRGLSLLSQGHSAAETLQLLLRSDPESAERQVGIVDARGRSAAHTGTGCSAWAGSVEGENYTAQGNILTGEEVVRAMGERFEAAEGSLADRLLAALEAGDAAGGDSRGRQSAAILVVRDGGGYAAMNDRYLDLRVDDHERPIEELARIYGIWRQSTLLRDAFAHYEKQQWDAAIRLAEQALAADPTNTSVRYNLACFHARAAHAALALQHLEAAIAADASLRNLAADDEDFASLRQDERWRRIVIGNR